MSTAAALAPVPRHDDFPCLWRCALTGLPLHQVEVFSSDGQVTVHLLGKRQERNSTPNVALNQ